MTARYRCCCGLKEGHPDNFVCDRDSRWVHRVIGEGEVMMCVDCGLAVREWMADEP